MMLFCFLLRVMLESPCFYYFSDRRLRSGSRRTQQRRGLRRGGPEARTHRCRAGALPERTVSAVSPSRVSQPASQPASQPTHSQPAYLQPASLHTASTAAFGAGRG